ncbi:hypothetical protein [Peptoniphilus sp. HCN-40583]|uniref:hypothetical protein n=1 Tax=Peptoniphilus sp. HCN-40583 TaxID=3134662 RepID=UPI0030C4655C
MTNKSLTNYGKIYWDENERNGEKERVYLSTDLYGGQTIALSPTFKCSWDHVTVGYVDIIQESWCSDWDTTYWDEYTELIYDYLIKQGIAKIEKGDAFARFTK